MKNKPYPSKRKLSKMQVEIACNCNNSVTIERKWKKLMIRNHKLFFKKTSADFLSAIKHRISRMSTSRRPNTAFPAWALRGVQTLHFPHEHFATSKHRISCMSTSRRPIIIHQAHFAGLFSDGAFFLPRPRMSPWSFLRRMADGTPSANTTRT